MRLLVPIIEHGRDAAFPISAPGSVYVTVVVHSTEEDHLQYAEEQEQEEDGEANSADWEEAKVMTIARTVWMIAVSIAGAVRHWRESLSIFSGFRDGSRHSGSLGNALGFPGFESHETACGHEAEEEYNSDQPKHETITKHFYLQ